MYYFYISVFFFLQGKAIPQASSTKHLSSEIERAKHFIEDSLKKASARVSTATVEGQTLAWSIWFTTALASDTAIFIVKLCSSFLHLFSSSPLLPREAQAPVD